MEQQQPSIIQCRRLVELDIANWDAVREALRDTEPCEYRQYWLDEPSELFQPATARVGWTCDALIVYAELSDLDIFNPVTTFNEQAFTEGDAFEVFLRPRQQDAYFEIHVTPMNQKFQLRFESGAFFQSLKGRKGEGDPLESCKFYTPVIESQTRIAQERNRWEVVAALPFSFLVERGTAEEGSEWLFSFSRYDHTRGLPAPTLSSTSPHAVCNFHRQEEWGILVFTA